RRPRPPAALALKLHNIVASGVWCLEPALMLLCCHVRGRCAEAQNDGKSVTEATWPNAGPQPRPADATRALLEATLKRARWTIFLERLWAGLTPAGSALRC